jgi:alkanesulfonate monooxygenase SsuD/methylene tetrahydromethanopterin reductase-like flavin-dependent oxidoreductase (luciferase family)
MQALVNIAIVNNIAVDERRIADLLVFCITQLRRHPHLLRFPPMQLAVMTEPQTGGSYEQLLAAARFAEESDLDAFARSDHYYWNRDPVPEATDAYATIAGLARETAGIRLCILVSPVTFRHPAVIAKTAATIDQMSQGRLDLGIGTGWMEEEHRVYGIDFPDTSERFSRMEEAIRYLRAAFGGDPFTGQHFRIEADARPRPQGIRLIVGGSGERRTPRLAGELADEYNMFFRRPEEVSSRTATMRAAAEAVGRDPAAIALSLMGPVAIGGEGISRAATQRGVEASELESRWRAAGVPCGSPEEVTDQMGRYREAGVAKVYFQWFDLTDFEGLVAGVTALRGALG